MHKVPEAVVEAITLGIAKGENAGPFKDALAAHKRGDYATVLSVLRPLAAQGDARGQYYLGDMYGKGQGVPQDYKEAVRWYGLAAAQGNANAQYTLGVMYRYGQGAPHDYKEAVRFFGLAAAQGHANAQFCLGFIYRVALGVPQDHKEAVRWYRLAAAQGDARAQNNLGHMYSNGIGVPQNYVRAHMWYNLSASSLSSEDGKKAIENRNYVAAKMTPAQLEQAQEMARKCKESNFKNCD